MLDFNSIFRLAYWLKSRYYGQAGEKISDKDLESKFKRHNIDYYFFRGDPDSAHQLLNHFREITDGEIPGLNIYLNNE